MAKIKVIEKELHATIVKRHRSTGDYCEVIVRYTDPDTGKYRAASQITAVAWNTTDQTRDYVLKEYGEPLISRVDNYLKGIDTSLPEEITFADYMDKWLKWREDKLFRIYDKIAETTLNSNKSAVAVIKPYFIKHPILLHRLREEHIEGLIKWLRDKGRDNNYIRIKIDLIDQILERAVKDKYIERNPLKYMDKPRKDKRPEKEYLEMEQLRSVLERVKGNDLEPLIMLMVYLGIRIGEALGLTWDNVDFEKNIITICKQCRDLPGDRKYSNRLKRPNSYRSFVMHEDLRNYLLALQEQQAKDREYCGNSYREPAINVVVRKWNGWNLSKNQWREKFRKFMARQTDLPYITPHGLRHSFNASLQHKGVPLEIRSMLVGDALRTVATSYNHPSEQIKNEALLQYGDDLKRKN